jgi:type I restriction enzyme S subunit
MNATRLLTYFDRTSEAPDAVPRFRRFILDLAVRGKLVEQDSTAETATELLKDIEEAKARLVESGKIKKQEPVPPVEIEDRPFELPAHWQWVRFGAIADFSAGRTPSRDDSSFWNTGDYNWVSIADMNDGGVIDTTKESVSEKARTQLFRSEPSSVGTLIMSFKLTIGKIAHLGVPAFHNEAIISIHPHLPDMDGYLFKVLPQFSKRGDTKDAIKGATLNRDSITSILLPIPPLAEQHRIVAKIDELMALCDRLEAAQAERENRRNRLNAASLQRLTEPVGHATAFQEQACFAIRHLSRFTTRPEQTEKLRETVIDLAVRGRLVAQSSNDEPAPKLLRRIEMEASQAKALVPIKTPRTVDAGQGPYEIPSSWSWIRLQDLLPQLQNGESSRGVDGGVSTIVLRLADVKRRKISLADVRTLQLPRKAAAKYELLDGDILIVRVNGSADIVGQFVVCEQVAGLAYCDHFIRMRVRPQWVAPRFLGILGQSALLRDQIRGLFVTTAGQKTVNQGHIGSLTLPLPPVNEQHRIVAKVDELMSLCDQLETHLTTAQSVSRHLLEALLHEALGEAA